MWRESKMCFDQLLINKQMQQMIKAGGIENSVFEKALSKSVFRTGADDVK